MYIALKLLGQNVICEPHFASGRADCVVENDKYVYIFEFKLDKTADEALTQIDEKGLPCLTKQTAEAFTKSE